MKQIIFLVSLLVFSLGGICPKLTVKIDRGDGTGEGVSEISSNGNIEVSSKSGQIKKFKLKSDDLPDKHKLKVLTTASAFATGSPEEYTKRGEFVEFAFAKDIAESEIKVSEFDEKNTEVSSVVFKIMKTLNAADDNDENDDKHLAPLAEWIETSMKDYKVTRIGLQKGDEEHIVHIFLDEFGNNMFTTMPQGISGCQYLVHIFYKGYSDKPDNVSYSINQKSGSFTGGLLINNSGILSKIPANFQKEETNGYDVWHEKTFLLPISETDISFDVVVTKKDEKNKVANVVLNTYTIKMAPLYHVSMDIGLINSQLSNTTYTLVESPSNAAEKIVKETNSKPQGLVTVMATFYTSPIVLIEKLFFKNIGKKIPEYKLTGRNFFDDHKIYERIYPTVGVSISSKVFDNLFFGLNWEIARGLSLFGGGHWGKVNTFELPNYKTGITVVNQSEFDYYTNKKWKVDWAYGVKLDILVITNLFK